MFLAKQVFLTEQVFLEEQVFLATARLAVYVNSCFETRGKFLAVEFKLKVRIKTDWPAIEKAAVGNDGKAMSGMSGGMGGMDGMSGMSGQHYNDFSGRGAAKQYSRRQVVPVCFNLC